LETARVVATPALKECHLGLLVVQTDPKLAILESALA
jgi:hypothetical protein